MNEDKCFIIDSAMNITTIRQSKIQELLNKKDIAPLDIYEQIGNDGCFIDELVVDLLHCFGKHNEYEIQSIINRLNDELIEIEVQ